MFHLFGLPCAAFFSHSLPLSSLVPSSRCEHLPFFLVAYASSARTNEEILLTNSDFKIAVFACDKCIEHVRVLIHRCGLCLASLVKFVEREESFRCENVLRQSNRIEVVAGKLRNDWNCTTKWLFGLFGFPWTRTISFKFLCNRLKFWINQLNRENGMTFQWKGELKKMKSGCVHLPFAMSECLNTRFFPSLFYTNATFFVWRIII